MGGERIGQLPLRYDQVQIKAFFLSFSLEEHSAGMPYKLLLPKKNRSARFHGVEGHKNIKICIPRSNLKTSQENSKSKVQQT